jgi:type IX secretion system PorP/SprF family membrane protein
MMSKNTISRASLIAALALTTMQTAQAQDVHFTQFTASPLIVNPAFTGGFSGQWRAAAVYRDQWRSVVGSSAFKTYAISFDAPIVSDLTLDDYLAGGIQLYNDRAGDGDLTNLSALASIAYHKFLGKEVNKSISVGFQGGYGQKSIDLSRLYFGNEFQNGNFEPGTGGESLNNKTSYFVMNAGIAWAHSAGSNFSYAIGLGANNMNKPNETLQKKANSEVGLGMRYTAQVGAIAYLGEKLSLRPAFLYQNQSTATEMVAGNEFNLIVGNPEFRNFTTAVFLGGWYRFEDAIMINAGLEFKGFRLGLSYDYNVSDLKNASNGNGGWEISLTYVAPDPLDFARKLIYPCSRF